VTRTAPPARSIRTCAWLGDAYFELELRRRIAARGDWPVARLDRVRAALSRAEAQARLLEGVLEQLDEEESELVRRGRNASVRSGGRVKRDVKSYRAATAFEVLVDHWLGGHAEGRARFDALLAPAIEDAIDEAFARSEKLKRG
jgi:ribonuclease-3 family protein